MNGRAQKIFGSFATVRKYRVNPQSIAILKRAKSFREWLSPNIPEDLLFIEQASWSMHQLHMKKTSGTVQMFNQTLDQTASSRALAFKVVLPT